MLWDCVCICVFRDTVGSPFFPISCSRHDLAYPIFEGAFSVNEETYHVKTSSSYKRVKRSDDVDLHHGYDTTNHVRMVIYRDSDTVLPAIKRDLGDDGDACGFDKLSYNNNNNHNNPALSLSTPPSLASGRLSKRAPAGCPATKKSKAHVSFSSYICSSHFLSLSYSQLYGCSG